MVVLFNELIKGGENMKKEWQKPNLEVLDVKMTMTLDLNSWSGGDRDHKS
jgi:hypothetical protein